MHETAQVDSAAEETRGLATSEPVFRVIGITKTYQMGDIQVAALRGIDLSLFPGELVVLLGPSGSGKSTLLNIIGGLDIPTGGQVFYRSQNLTTADDQTLTHYRREHVGFVFQFYNLVPTLTARENVALVTDLSERSFKPEEALGLVDMAHRLDHFPSQLSGGEQQRVAIARAISKRPDVLLCDEPTGALDITTGKVVLRAISDINAKLGTTTILITHNAAIAAMADRVLQLGDGQIVADERNDSRSAPQELTW